MASNATSALITSRVMPLPAADRISARFQPKVHFPAAGRAARRMAHSDAPRAPTSELSRCWSAAHRSRCSRTAAPHKDTDQTKVADATRRPRE